ncbi:MAG TPA: maleylpyruvate isomerase family mycothiol-dependent enzyme [Bryobacteraceae bacterium]|nr:maleylpyruvate isomerase family mycothiol-dependent enzyme [Bryobacteraceae bacterium]
MKRPGPILVGDRFAPLRGQLLALLGSLGEDDWDRPTAAPGWSVKDVTAHLVGGDFAILSGKRDGFRGTYKKVDDYAQLVDLINRLNAQWVQAMSRMSQRLLMDLLAFTGPEVERCFAALDPMKMGGPVSWAGPDPALVWFDIAREFTERWHHQQQIRDATGRPPLYDPYFLSPVLDTFVRALPYSFRHLTTPEGTVVRFEISGDAGGAWFLHRTSRAWTLSLDSEAEPATEVILPQDTAWRLFTKGIDRQEARARAAIRGDAGLASPIFETTSIIG